jgi:tetratricopeptide (TPR) repeat protein
MKRTWYIPVLLAVLAGQGIAQPSEFAAGRASYGEGEFRTAVAHFQIALRTDPRDAASNYWMGRSYETLADIATPFGGKYRSLARAHLTKAVELAPNRPEYRRELFDFLVDSDGFSRSERQQAREILLGSAESDPDYDYMRSRFEQAYRLNSSVNARLGRLLLAAPQGVFRIGTAWR